MRNEIRFLKDRFLAWIKQESIGIPRKKGYRGIIKIYDYSGKVTGKKRRFL